LKPWEKHLLEHFVGYTPKKFSELILLVFHKSCDENMFELHIELYVFCKYGLTSEESVYGDVVFEEPNFKWEKLA
jgi:hypothetical protein